MHCTLEVCVDSTASALAAKRGGADRLELCADLIIGGTTPSPALLRQVKAETGLPVRALLRPRFGDFCYDRYELAQMAECAAELIAAGADGIVTGVLTPAGALDTDALRPIYAAARQAAEKAHRTVDCTLHRAFDVCCDPFAALEAAKQLGLATILTSGQAASAPQGAALLRQLVEAAGGFKVQPEKLVSGGPMMGFAIFGLDVPTTKTTSSLLCLGKDEVAEFEPLACISCGRCVEACPEKLIPSRLAKFSEHGQKDEFERWHGLECIECGSCSYVCPSRRQVAQSVKTMKKLVLADKRKKK